MVILFSLFPVHGSQILTFLYSSHAHQQNKKLISFVCSLVLLKFIEQE